MSVMRKCVCCGRQYEYCPRCIKKNQPIWKMTFCSETCKELFNVVSAYNTQRVEKSAVRSFIASHGIKDCTHYSGPIKRVLEEIIPTL